MAVLPRLLGESAVADIDDYLRAGGGVALLAALERDPDDLVTTVERSGLRGRGGSGFPTGTKWRTVAQASDSTRPMPVVVNAAEGEPGTFKDRALLRQNPYLTLEGSRIAAHAVGATEVIIAVKASFRHEIGRLRRAIDETRALGWFDDLPVAIVEGPGEYLFGEETALLEVIDGRQPFPRVAPPYRRGITDAAEPEGGTWRGDGTDALVDNVETLANLPGIIAHGPDWFRSVGTPESPGTIICTVTGDTQRHGVGEFAMGTPLRRVIDEVGGGPIPHGRIAAVLSGVSNRPIGPDALDTPLTYEAMARAGSGLGSASFIVVDDRTPLMAVAAGVARFLAIESCGQCEPCKRDGLAIAGALASGPTPGDLDLVDDRLGTVARGARCNLANQTEQVVGAILALAADRSPTTTDTYDILPLVDIIGGRAIVDVAHRDKRADWSYPGDGPDSHAWPAQQLADQPVRIRAPKTPEPARGPTRPEPDRSPDPEPFATLIELHRRIETAMAAARACGDDGRCDAVRELCSTVERHRYATEHLIYPLVSRHDAEGDDISWYPEHHEAKAAELLRDLELEAGDPRSGRLDAVCRELQLTIDELELRILPTLQRELDVDREALLVTSDLNKVILEP